MSASNSAPPDHANNREAEQTDGEPTYKRGALRDDRGKQITSGHSQPRLRPLHLCHQNGGQQQDHQHEAHGSPGELAGIE